ncbi:putative DASH complex subunit Dad2 [Colletotrichum sublineola]|uniref:Putative DASH complex subunit Dad2 n=1 Tax=Colletotrichum sublineola TaxID=1173701 RepID=A0A066XU68_COLSU|nr:putative DASH complex subunit Dad2 [Colletotrichum sublineola]
MSFPTRSLSTRLPRGRDRRTVAEKTELEDLKELRDLSAAVADQMEASNQKLATLPDGTKGEDGWFPADYLAESPVSWTSSLGLPDL